MNSMELFQKTAGIVLAAVSLNLRSVTKEPLFSKGISIHRHEGFELRFALDGSGNLTGSELIFPGTAHRALTKEEIGESISLSLDPLFFRFREEPGFFITSPYAHKLEELLAALDTAGKAEEGLFQKELQLLLALLFLKALPEKSPEHTGAMDMLIHTIGLNYYKPDLSIGKLARSFGYSPNYIQRCFLKIEGITPKAYLQQIRMKAALRFLREKKYSLKEIASLCGFRDVHYFSNAFKRYYGCAPKFYRIEEGEPKAKKLNSFSES